MSANVRMLRYLVVAALVLTGTLLTTDGLAPVPSSAGGDTTPPELVAFDFEPKVVDTSSGPQAITFTAHLTDSPAGLAGDGYMSSPTQVRFRSPSGSQFVDAVFSGDWNRVSGTRQDGVFEDQVTLPQFVEQGTWRIEQFLLVDQVGNMTWLSEAQIAALGFPTTFEQVAEGDTTPPELVAFDFEPKVVDTSSGPQAITFTAHLTDSPAGLAGDGYMSSPTQVRFRSPSGSQFVDAVFSGDWNRVSGTRQDGVFEDQVTLPQFVEQGTWRIEQFLLVDQVGNMTWLSAAQIAALGFPTTFEVGPVIADNQLDAVSLGAEVMLFGRSPANDLWFRETDGGVFGPWTTFNTASSVDGDPQGLRRGNGDVYVFFRGPSGDLRYAMRDGVTATWSLDSLGGQILGDPVVAADADGDLVVVVAGTSGGLWYRRLPAGSDEFEEWAGMDGVFPEANMTIATLDGDLYLIGLDSNRSAWARVWDGATNAWGSWDHLGGYITSAELTLVSHAGELHFLVLGGDGALFSRTYSGGWGAWTAMDGQLEGMVGAVSSGGAVLLAGVNRTGGSWSRTSSDGVTWSSWEFMGGLVATTPEMAATDTGAFYFAQSASGGVWYREWDAETWGAWTSLGGAIASE